MNEDAWTVDFSDFKVLYIKILVNLLHEYSHCFKFDWLHHSLASFLNLEEFETSSIKSTEVESHLEESCANAHPQQQQENARRAPPAHKLLRQNKTNRNWTPEARLGAHRSRRSRHWHATGHEERWLAHKYAKHAQLSKKITRQNMSGHFESAVFSAQKFRQWDNFLGLTSDLDGNGNRQISEPML